MDITLTHYNHTSHFHLFWPIFCDFWREVNGEEMAVLINLQMGDGTTVVSSRAENKILRILEDGKTIKLAMLDGRCIGWCQYAIIEGGVIYFSSMYVLPEMRYLGLSRLFMNSLPGLTKAIFQIHKDMPPEAMLMGLDGATRIGPCEDRDLELWEFTYNKDVQGENAKMIDVREKFKKRG